MGELKRRAPLKRSGRVRAVNRQRKRKADARNFGEEAKRVREMQCLCYGHPSAVCKGVADRQSIEAAHVKARGMGAANGGRFDLVPLCPRHHDSSAAGVEAFEATFGLDLRAEADRIAVGHQEPLGIRGLARRWVGTERRSSGLATWEHAACTRREAGESIASLAHDFDKTIEEIESALVVGRPLDDYERSALLGWVRRVMDAIEPEDEHDVLVDGERIDAVAEALGLTIEQAVALCEAAGRSS